MATNGRMDAHLAYLTWRWRWDADRVRGIVDRVRLAGLEPEWYSMCPAEMTRPNWIPADAVAFALPHGDTGYVW